MSRISLIFIILLSNFGLIPESSAAENSITPYTVSNEYFSLSITLENLSRPTFQVLDGTKSPIFVPGDNVSYLISFKPNRDFIWSKTNELMNKQFGNKYRLNDSKMHLGMALKYGDNDAIGISETYQYQPNKFLENRLSGVMVVPEKKNLILTWLGIDIHAMAQSIKIVSTKTATTEQLGQPVSIELDVIDFAENQVVFIDNSKTPQAFGPMTIGPISISNQFIQLSTKISSNLAITGLSSTSSTCSYMSGVIALKKTGNCLIILTQPGNEIYAAAKPLVLSFKINPAKKSVKICPTSSKVVEVSASKKCPIN